MKSCQCKVADMKQGCKRRGKGRGGNLIWAVAMQANKTKMTILKID